ncbi:MAG: hypothetical protein LBK73_03540 [Treponema sp.]|nr:hypothetical protein [Treponema sp.]
MKPASKLWFDSIRHGPYPLTNQDIDKHVAKKCLGNHLLGSIANGEFIPRYAGRSDSDLNRRIKEHIHEGYGHFKFDYAKSVIDAYNSECKHYHTFKDLNEPCDNDRHPDKPDDQPHVKCPYCKI